MRKQRAFLRHVADAALLGRHVQVVAGHAAAVDFDAAAIRAFEAAQQTQQGGLAAAGRSEQREQRAALDGEIDAV